jgi:hypothetical protein
MDSVFITALSFTKPVDSVQVSIMPRNAANTPFKLLSVEMENSASKAIYHSLAILELLLRGMSKGDYLPG